MCGTLEVLHDGMPNRGPVGVEWQSNLLPMKPVQSVTDDPVRSAYIRTSQNLSYVNFLQSIEFCGRRLAAERTTNVARQAVVHAR